MFLHFTNLNKTAACSLAFIVTLVSASSAFAKVVVIPLGGDVRLGNVVTVAKSGGQYKSIESALNSVSHATASNPVIIYVAPGTYNRGDKNRLILKEHVTIVGAGIDRTIITSNGSFERPVFEMNNNSGLRSLTVVKESAAGEDGAAVDIIGRTGVKLDDVKLVNLNGSGASEQFGVYSSLGGSFVMTNSTIEVSQQAGSGKRAGIGLIGSTGAEITGTKIDVSSAGGTNYGIDSTLSTGEVMFSFGEIVTNNVFFRTVNDTATPIVSHSTVVGNPSGAPICYSIFNKVGNSVACT